MYSTFNRNPIINNKVYAPYLLIFAFLEKLRTWMGSELNIVTSRMLKRQLNISVLLAITEKVPLNQIIQDFYIGDDFPLDIAFIYDNKFFIINTIEENFNSNLTNMIIASTLEKFAKIKHLLSNGEIEIKGKGIENVKLKGYEPMFIIVYDNLGDQNVFALSGLKDQFVLLSPFDLNYIFEDLLDSGRDVNYFYKAIKY